MRYDEENATRSYPFNSVQAVCQAFTMGWQSDSHRSLGGYLENVSEAARPALLRNLLQIDIERRRGAGQQPQASDYIEGIPGHEALIRKEFAETTLWLGSSRSIRSDETEHFEDSAYQRPATRRLGDYHLVRELGEGGMGVVFETAWRKHCRRRQDGPYMLESQLFDVHNDSPSFFHSMARKILESLKNRSPIAINT